ncbi:MAG TPA: aminopeptidase [Labilithrix sp.]
MGRALMLALVLTTTGCGGGLRYVTQAAAGQEDLNRRGVPIADIVDKGYLDKRTRDLLAHVPRIKAFAEANGLKHTNNYTRYVWLPRPAVVWVVTACDPLQFRPKTWSYPVVGSFVYTGWFDEKEAHEVADDLAKEGWDTDVRPSGAYSTIGWFEDAVLSSMFDKGPGGLGELADTVIHETLHASYFVKDQSTLNESVASFVGDNLGDRYLAQTLGDDAPDTIQFRKNLERSRQRGMKMREAYFALETLYKSHAPREEKLAEKARIVSELRAKLRLTRPITNATLIQYKTYGSGREELDALLRDCDGSFPRLLALLEEVRGPAKTAPKHTDPALLLRPLVERGTCR